MSQHLRRPGDGVVIIALVGSTLVLLIKEITKPAPHFLKLISEKLHKDEPLKQAVCRAVQEEAGLENLQLYEREGGVLETADDRILSIEVLVQPEELLGRNPHWRYVYVLRCDDGLVASLAGKRLVGDADEIIDTYACKLHNLHMLPGILAPHRQLIARFSRSDAAAAG